MFNGIKIEFNFDEHPPPHFHARYAEFVAQIDLESLEISRNCGWFSNGLCRERRPYERRGPLALLVAIPGESNEGYPPNRFRGDGDPRYLED